MGGNGQGIGEVSFFLLLFNLRKMKVRVHARGSMVWYYLPKMSASTFILHSLAVFSKTNSARAETHI